MAEHGRPNPPPPASAMAWAEQQATTNLAAFLHWLAAVHGLRLEPRHAARCALRGWAEANPATASRLILRFAGAAFASARLAAGLLLDADLRPDDGIVLRGQKPAWLPQALQATQGLAERESTATVLIADHPPQTLPPKLRRLILIGGRALSVPPEITVSRPEHWTYPRESSAD